MKLVFNPFTGSFDWISVEDLSGYVPYIGATTNVTLGNHTLSVGSAPNKTSFFGGALMAAAFNDGVNKTYADFAVSTEGIEAAGILYGGEHTITLGSVWSGNAIETDGPIVGPNVTSGSNPGHSHTAYQPIDGDLTAIAALGFTATAFLKKTAANTWALDTNTYLTEESDPVFTAWLEAGNDCPTMVDVSAAAVAEGNNSFSITYDKVLIKWLKITTTSTDWTLTLYTKDDYATGEMVVVSGRSGDFNVYLDLPYADADETNELHYNFATASGTETHDIQVLGYKLK